MPEPVQAAVDTAAPDDAAYRAELAKMMKGDAEAMGLAVDKDEPEKKPDEPATDEEKPDEEEKPEGDEAEGDEEKEGDEEPESEEEKGKYSKAFRKLQREAQQLSEHKAQVLAKDREVAQREQATAATERELVDFIKNVKLDPFGTLLRLGILKEEDAEYISKQLYYHSKTAQADPKSRAEAERLRAERERRMEHESLVQRTERLERERVEERQQAQREQQLNQYTSRLEATVQQYAAKTPELKRALERSPAQTKKEILLIANELSEAKGQYADPGLVALAWIKERKRILADLQAEAAKPATTAATKPDQSKKAAEKRGPTDGKANGSSAQSAEEAAEAKYQRNLRRHLNGEPEGD